MSFVDIEAALMDWAEANIAALPPGNVGTDTPADLQSRLPFMRVERVTGSDDRITDYSVVDIEIYAATRAQALAVAEEVRWGLVQRSPQMAGTVYLDRVRTETAPHRLPTEDDNLRRFLGTYDIEARP